MLTKPDNHRDIQSHVLRSRNLQELNKPILCNFIEGEKKTYEEFHFTIESTEFVVFILYMTEQAICEW